MRRGTYGLRGTLVRLWVFPVFATDCSSWRWLFRSSENNRHHARKFHMGPYSDTMQSGASKYCSQAGLKNMSPPARASSPRALRSASRVSGTATANNLLSALCLACPPALPCRVTVQGPSRSRVHEVVDCSHLLASGVAIAARFNFCHIGFLSHCLLSQLVLYLSLNMYRWTVGSKDCPSMLHSRKNCPHQRFAAYSQTTSSSLEKQINKSRTCLKRRQPCRENSVIQKRLAATQEDRYHLRDLLQEISFQLMEVDRNQKVCELCLARNAAELQEEALHSNAQSQDIALWSFLRVRDRNIVEFIPQSGHTSEALFDHITVSIFQIAALSCIVWYRILVAESGQWGTAPPTRSRTSLCTCARGHVFEPLFRVGSISSLGALPKSDDNMNGFKAKI